MLSAGWASAGAPDYAVVGSVVAANGVHHASNACLTLSSVVGQAVAGIAVQLPAPTFGYSIDSGFWATVPSSSSDTLMNDNFEVCR
ncbi:MAG: hypothetical protein ABI843_08825 [Dokdonella sp.]